MHRRRILLTVGSGATVLLLGCLTMQRGPDARLEYDLTVDTEPQQLPEDLRHRQHENSAEGLRPEGYQWVVVEFEVIAGEFDAADMFTNSRVETENGYYYHLAYTMELAKGIMPRSTLSEGTEAIALYQIPEDEDVVNWDLSPMDQDVELAGE